MKNLTIADLIPELTALAAPVSDGAAAPPNTYLMDLNLITKSTADPVSYRAAIPLESYLPIISSPLRLAESGVTIYNNSPQVVVPATQPATSCVSMTCTTTTTKQSHPRHIEYGAALSYPPYPACVNNRKCTTIEHGMHTHQSA